MVKNKILNQSEIQKIEKIKGKARGVTFRTDAEFILKEKGEETTEKIKKELRKINAGIPFDPKTEATKWYPLSWRVFSLLAIKNFLDWSDEDLFRMGQAAPKHSFLVKVILRYFASLEKTFQESGKYWNKHYSIGKLSSSYEEEGKLVLRLEEFEAHPVLCPYFKGYFLQISKLITHGEKIKIEETKCIYQGDDYHEYIIIWE